MLIFEKTTKKADFINPLPNDECFDMTKLKASADDKLNVAKMPTSLCDRVENTVGKEENAGFVWERVTHETLPEWLPQWILGQVWNWVMSGQKPGHLVKS